MSFLQLNFIFVGIAVVVLLFALFRRGAKYKAVKAVAASLVALLLLTAVFDNVMIASGLFDYGSETLHGLHVGLAPIEDFAYPLAAILLLPGLWLLFTRGKKA